MCPEKQIARLSKPIVQPRSVQSEKAKLAPRASRNQLQRVVGNYHLQRVLRPEAGQPDSDSIAKAGSSGFHEDVEATQASGNTGRPLDQKVRKFFESFFHKDLSHVVVLTGDKPAESAKSLDAAAYTKGNEIFFARGHFEPHTERGRRLIAHELVHTLQQKSSSGTTPSLIEAERESDAVVSAMVRGRPVPTIGVGSAAMVMREGFGDLRVAEEKQETEARAKLTELAGRLLEVQLKSDRLQPAMSGSTALEDQQQILVQHLDRTTKLLQKAGAGSLVDSTLIPAIQIAIDAGGLAADLMYLDRVGAASGISRVSRAGANKGLSFAWGSMRKIAEDPLWATTNRAEAEEWIRAASFHRDTVADFLSTAEVLKKGVTAAQLADLFVSGPELLATGKAALKDLGKWLTEGGGGTGVLQAAAPGVPGGLMVASGGRTLVLTAAQVEALVQAGKLSANALVLFNLSKSGGGTAALPPSEGPLGARPPGSKSRFKTEDVVRDLAEETGKVPTGERALEEAGVGARQLRKIDENHHLLVQQLRRWFRSRGVEIDKFTVKLTADEHRWIHNEYRWNDLWKEFRLKNPKASPEEILAQRDALMKKVGLEGLEIVPYPK